MAVDAKVTSQLLVVETLTATGAPGSKAPQITYDGYNTFSRYNATTTPAASVNASFKVTLSGGAATIDMTALTGTNGAAVNANALKPRAIKFLNVNGNHAMTIVKGATNGYTGFGANFSLTLPTTAILPGTSALFDLVDGASAVGSTSKTLDITGTGTEVLEVIVIFG